MMDFRRKCLGLALAAAVLATGALPALAALPAKTGGRAASPFGIQRPAGAASIDNRRRIDINNINMFVTNIGSFAWDLFTGDPGLIYPKGSLNTAVFASGLWVGATVNGETRVTVSVYGQEYGPGAMTAGGGFDDPDKPQYIVYKVIPWTGEPEDTARVSRDTGGDVTIDPLVHHSWSEYLAGAAPYGAPTRLWRIPDLTTDSETDSVDVLGPDVIGDQMLWCVYNDANPANHTDDAGNSTPLGIEVQHSTFAFNRQGALGNTIFLKYVIINKGTNLLENTYVSLWSDPDLGGAADDLVGVDVDASLGYVYNATNNDELYGKTPPAVGYDFFLGPVEAGDTLGLASFNKYINGTDPHDPIASYNYMRGLEPDGSQLINPLTGEVTRYYHTGDPVTGTGWLDSNPADRRFLLSSGPFTMAPGDTQIVVGAVIVGQGKDRLSSISGLRFFDRFAQDAFDVNFDLPSPPPQPNVEVTTDHGQVTLCWDAASRLNYNEPGYVFEGYNVYQGESISGPWRLIATYDEVNAVRVIFDEVFDIETGQLIPQFPVAFGSDVGVSFCHTVKQDAIRGGPLNDATEYYFAVTSYAYGPDEQPKVLENAQEVITVMPQRPALGTDPSTAAVVNATYTRIDTNRPPATDVVTATVVAPNVVRNACYRVVFSPLSPPYPQVGGQDVLYAWSLVNVTTGDTLLRNQINRTADDDYRVIEGIQVRVLGQYAPAFQEAVYDNANPAHRRALTGVDWGGFSFFGGADTGWNFWGGSLDPAAAPDSFTTVEIRWGESQKAYRYLRLEQADGSAPAIGRGYIYGGFHDQPFQVWDAINNVQLDAAYVERGVTDAAGTLLDPSQQLASFDSTWAPTADDLGDREYFFAIRRPYSDTPKAELAADDAINSPDVPILYGLWSRLRAATDVIDPGDIFRFVWANPATSNDVYDFCTTPLLRGNAQLAAQGLDRIRVVPNPYYTRSTYELSQFNRVVKFINMPENATVRIFNLAGNLVRTIRKEDPTTSVLEWNLETDNRLPIASGIYIYHVDVPGAGSTHGRLVVFMEKERLNTF